METGAGAPEQAAMIRPHKANTAAARALPYRHDLLSTISPPGSSPDEQEGHSRTKRLNPHRRVRHPAAVRRGLSDLASIISQPRESASYRRHRFPPAVIQHAIWLYLRFTLSYRDVEELLAERGLAVSYETVRRWVLKFGPRIARKLRRCRPRPSNRWHLDEMVVRIAGKRMYLVWGVSCQAVRVARIFGPSVGGLRRRDGKQRRLGTRTGQGRSRGAGARKREP